MSNPKESPFIPVTYGHDEMSPIGYVKFDDERILLKINEKAKISSKDIQTMNMAFAPTYLITKEKNGFVTEVEIASFATVSNK